MKHKVLRLSLVCLLFFLIGASCQDKEEWTEIMTNDNNCSEFAELKGTLIDAKGEVKAFNNEFIIVIKDMLGESELRLYPCNITMSDLKAEHEIIFSGEAYELIDNVVDSVASSKAADLLIISNAQILK